MRVIEFLGVEVVGVGLFAWWFLAWYGTHKKKVLRETAQFVGGPLDGQKRKMHRFKPSYYERITEHEYAVYTHDQYGVYVFANYVEE